MLCLIGAPVLVALVVYLRRHKFTGNMHELLVGALSMLNAWCTPELAFNSFARRMQLILEINSIYQKKEPPAIRDAKDTGYT